MNQESIVFVVVVVTGGVRVVGSGTVVVRRWLWGKMKRGGEIVRVALWKTSHVAAQVGFE